MEFSSSLPAISFGDMQRTRDMLLITLINTDVGSVIMFLKHDGYLTGPSVSISIFAISVDFNSTCFFLE